MCAAFCYICGMEKTTVFQDNAITRSSYNLSSMAKDAFLMMLKQLKKADDEKTLYYISTKEWATIQGSTTLKFKEVDDALNELRNTDIYILKENGNILKTKFISSVEYIKGTGVIEIGFSHKIRPYFFDLRSNFTTFQLEMALSLSSRYAKRIYELLSEDKRKDILKVSVSEIRTMLKLDVLDQETGKAKLTRWSDFEKSILKTPQTQLKNHTDISFTYEKKALEGGKKISHIVFFIKRKAHQQKIEFTDEETTIVSEMITKYKLSKKQSAHIVNTMNEREIRIIFNKIQTSFNPQKGSLGGLAAKLFDVKNVG
jgi:plasmid replication initiation protein